MGVALGSFSSDNVEQSAIVKKHLIHLSKLKTKIARLAVPDNNRSVVKAFEDCLGKEREKNETFVFYHGGTSVDYFTYLVINSLRKALAPETGGLQRLSAFRTFSFGDQYVAKFLTERAKEYGDTKDIVADAFNYVGDFDQHCISTNIFLTGNPLDMNSNSLMFFATNANAQGGAIKQTTSTKFKNLYKYILPELFKRSGRNEKEVDGLVKKYIDEFAEVYSRCRVEEAGGVLYQIFLDASTADKIAYVSEDYGVPIVMKRGTEESVKNASGILTQIKIDRLAINKDPSKLLVRNEKKIRGVYNKLKRSNSVTGMLLTNANLGQGVWGIEDNLYYERGSAWDYLEARILVDPPLFLLKNSDKEEANDNEIIPYRHGDWTEKQEKELNQAIEKIVEDLRKEKACDWKDVFAKKKDTQESLQKTDLAALQSCLKPLEIAIESLIPKAKNRLKVGKEYKSIRHWITLQDVRETMREKLQPRLAMMAIY
ncbi:hypothetical protein FACS189449_06450 [Alphaproteobacteria bacterium]|nr:hypothetical protein FACS189449_06450 [Alphaproteobacteria bacterium]